jgi:hypothetical protein
VLHRSKDRLCEHGRVASLDNLAAVPNAVLTVRLGMLGVAARRGVCDALAALANC